MWLPALCSYRRLSPSYGDLLHRSISMQEMFRQPFPKADACENGRQSPRFRDHTRVADVEILEFRLQVFVCHLPDAGSAAGMSTPVD